MDTPDADLIRRCIEGDNKGFDTLVKRYQKRVCGFCYRILGDSDQAADASQESFMKAYYALENFRADALFLPWLMKIASNTCIDAARKRTRRQTECLDERESDLKSISCGEPTPEEDLLKSERAEITRQAILELPMKCRTALVMFYYSGMGIKDISKALGRPEGTVKYDLHTAREMLRRKLEGIVVEI